MSQPPDDASPRVVKKVVKKAIVRPVTPGTIRPVTTPSSSGPAPTGPRARTARLTTPARAQAARPVATPTVAAPAPSSTSPPDSERMSETARVAPARLASDRKLRRSKAPDAAPLSSPVEPPTKTKRRLPAVPKPDIRGRVSGGFHAVGDRMSDAWHWLIGLRLPHLSPVTGSATTGVIVGLLCVAMGWGFYELFTAVLGTQAGGGWGFLAFVFLSFVAFLVGELLMSAFRVPHSRVVSILAVLLVLLIVLIFFIKLAAGIWAWLLVPVLFALGFVAASAIIAVATKEENVQ